MHSQNQHALLKALGKASNSDAWVPIGLNQDKERMDELQQNSGPVQAVLEPAGTFEGARESHKTFS